MKVQYNKYQKKCNDFKIFIKFDILHIHIYLDIQWLEKIFFFRECTLKKSND